jgi:TolB protein
MSPESQRPGQDEPDFYEDAYDEPVAEERRYPRATVLMSCFLLLVFLCATAVPAAGVLLWWVSASRQDRPARHLVGTWEQLSGTGPQPATERQNQVVDRIAFINLDGQLETIRPDGTDARQLTEHNHFFFFPAWSPDGTRLAVLGGNAEGGSVFTVTDSSAADNEVREIYHSTSQAPFYIYWSPDGSRVSFLANAGTGLGLFLAEASQTATTQLLATGQPFYWDWSPRGDQLLIHSGFAGHGSRLAFIDLQGDSQDPELARPGFFQAPGFSRSGRYWAYAEVDAAANRRLVVENDGGEQRYSLPHLGQLALSWSPTEERLAFTSPLVDLPAFHGPLRLLEPATGESRLLTSDSVIAFFWSPDGRRIAFITIGSQQHDTNVRTSYVPEATAPGSQTLPATGHQNGNLLLLDLWVVEVDGGEAYRLVTFQPTQIFVRQFLPFFDQYALSHRLWSPASDALVIPMADENGKPRIHIVPVDGRFTMPIADGAMAFWSHQ